MATAKQIADKMQRTLVGEIESQLSEIDKHLRKYDALIQQRTRLQAARRALLAERSVTQNGGKGLTQEELTNYMRSHESPYTVNELAHGLSATEAVIRGHLNRGKDERFKVELDEGVKKWSLREPEEDDDEEDDDE